MEQVESALRILDELCTSIRHFKDHYAPHAICRAPVIDHFHPDDYAQRGIHGITKFLARAETERDYVQAVLNSGVPPKDLTTNSVYLVEVWNEFQRSKWPLGSIAQFVDLPDGSQVKLDIVADGGDEWVKINTIKESRLTAEFREQDSYINSDYDSDSTDGSFHSSRSASPARLTSSLIEQAESLVQAARVYLRPVGLPPPRVRYVLSRLEAHPEGGYTDPRISATFGAIRALGVDLVLGAQPPPPLPQVRQIKLVPTPNIILDLSVIVALCCESTHHSLPSSPAALDARFRPLIRNGGTVELAPHTNVSRGLRDQLAMEVEHPLVGELRDRLNACGYSGTEINWFVTSEVRDRIPGIVNLIGGATERARVAALFGESDGDFWKGSRYAGTVGVLGNLRVKVLEDDDEGGALSAGMDGLDIRREVTTFDQRVIGVCNRMLDAFDNPTPTPSWREPSPAPSAKRGKGRKQKSQEAPRFPAPSRLPSGHTLRTLLRGVRGGMTVLTNNRGAIGKVVREVGILDGIPEDPGVRVDEEKAVVWVVNPSSLSEWRRVEVEEGNKRLLEEAVEVPT